MRDWKDDYRHRQPRWIPPRRRRWPGRLEIALFLGLCLMALVLLTAIPIVYGT